ncbi:MAG TPA: glutamate decarboxylase, partial [Ktedonobacteraceae bacterium]|nr:glutamate decarboxylase [Ktedonobacteraceae bacterium]
MLFNKVSMKDLSDAEQEITPVYSRHALIGSIPRYDFPTHELLPRTAYELIHDELLLDGNSRLNLATFVTTWMEPEARQLMAETFDKNMIDKDEYPQ